MIERYGCPWCPTIVINVEGESAMKVFEAHLDEHYAAQVGTTGPVVLPVPRVSVEHLTRKASA